MRLPMKPWQTPDTTPILPIALPIAIAVASTCGRGLGAAHDFEQPHDVGRREEVHADDAFGARRARGDFIDIEVAGVRREDGAGLGDAVELAENLLLDVHVLEHRFDDQIGILQIFQRQRRGQPAHAGFDFLHAEPALLGAVFVIAADDGDAAIERFLLGFDDGDRNADRQEVHRDAAAHGAGADDADRS